MAREPIAEWALERRVLRHLWAIDEDMGKVARKNRERTIECVLAIFAGRRAAGGTIGNSPGTKWRRSTRLPSTSTMAGATPAGQIRSSGLSRTWR